MVKSKEILESVVVVMTPFVKHYGFKWEQWLGGSFVKSLGDNK